MKLLLDDGNEHIGRHSAPDLRLDCVLAGAQKALDAQVLFDPLTEQFQLPAILVQAAMVSAGRVVLLVKNTGVFADSRSLKRMRRKSSARRTA